MYSLVTFLIFQTKIFSGQGCWNNIKIAMKISDICSAASATNSQRGSKGKKKRYVHA